MTPQIYNILQLPLFDLRTLFRLYQEVSKMDNWTAADDAELNRSKYQLMNSTEAVLIREEILEFPVPPLLTPTALTFDPDLFKN